MPLSEEGKRRRAELQRQRQTRPPDANGDGPHAAECQPGPEVVTPDHAVPGGEFLFGHHYDDGPALGASDRRCSGHPANP